MNEYEIKGMCEWCGFAYQGKPKGNDGVFDQVVCPSCGLNSQNFDQSYAVDELNKADGNDIDYQESELDII